MKIHTIFFLSEFVLGGAGNSIYKLCKNLPKKNYQISIICVKKCYYKKLFKKEGIDVYEINAKRALFAFFKIKKLLSKIISKNYKSNIFLSNINYSNVLTILFLRSLKLKICLIERTPFQELDIYYDKIDFIKKIIIKLFIKFTFHKADACISNSKYISKIYNKKYDLKFKTIFPPSFDGMYISKKKYFKNSKIKFITVCRLTKEKGLPKLIKIFSKYRKEFSLDIIGDGPELHNLRTLAYNTLKNKDVRFLGKINPLEIKFHLRKYDYYINFSDFEGFPNTVIESLSVGIPVLASQSYGGINEILSNKNFGLIFNKESVLEKYLKDIYNKKLIFKLNRSQIISHLNNFSSKKSVKNYDKLLKKLSK